MLCFHPWDQAEHLSGFYDAKYSITSIVLFSAFLVSLSTCSRKFDTKSGNCECMKTYSQLPLSLFFF